MSMHEELITNYSESKIVVIKGNHGIYHYDLKGVINLAEEWINRS